MTYLRYCLTDELACEETNISESNLYQMERGCYDPALAQLLGIGEIMSALPPIVVLPRSPGALVLKPRR
ncbi:L-xylulose/3-keto-L-gulonate kinase [Serratia fonticola]|uniref:L-xylulose/3-keto-L-gulonate kinase n=1 Tax=Serratia fonticola TaxID=47917 RepID=A0A4U9UCB1_SERFO|nr:L-xylulose/3-keto-L-gulonate kinase [Serratia fonticola]